MVSKPKVVVIGGGTGSFTVLSGLKELNIDLTALVDMADNGGSTGLLRDEFGVLPPGDVRQCLVALSDAPQSLRNLFNFRFPANGPLGGHSFGNLFLSAVEIMTDNFLESIKMASEVLNIRGRVVPVTTQKCQLVMETIEGRTIGQLAVDEKQLPIGCRPKIYLKPKAAITDEAKSAISEADLIVIAPGNLYTSIIPALLVEGMSESIRRSKAMVLYISNLVNKPNNTANFRVTDYVSEIQKIIGEGAIDYVLYNTDKPSKHLLHKYALDREYPVIIDTENLEKAKYVAISGKLLSKKPVRQDENDILLKRSLIRHNSEEVAGEVKKLLVRHN